ncbi:MAG: phenylalanine--tRNA ligase subunit beta [Eubacteriales bacterium]|nr:phenylalanine--tRNA ligase subunit beta [Eubacteriales bacterium]MDD4474878.1 phenylalanine--tRNA ligase subunit beta [Eubacteriales bacterium]
MKVSLNWLRDYVDVDCSVSEYSKLMTDTGTKVEEYEQLGEELKNIYVGKVLSVEKHKDSDHLFICKVDMGDKTLQIVTGAQNVLVGSLVPVAVDGAVVEGGKKIKSGKLRGELSEGMLCSLEELGLTINDFPYAEEDGIFLLQEDCKPGDDVKKVCMLEDTVVDFELTFNRPDCLAMHGIARESAVTLGKDLRINVPAVDDKIKNGKISPAVLKIDVLDKELCPRYCAAIIKNVKIEPSPLWLRSRLRTMGVRPINNIVDITNYVMLEYGQPMHAFDYNYIGSKHIVVRRANKDEKITTLDGNIRELTEDMLVIADGGKPVALAGIMGGENSEILDTTTTVVFESANFSRSSVRKTATALGMRTESSARFEKGLPAVSAMSALLRAIELVTKLNAGEPEAGIIDVNNADISSHKVPFEPEKINAILGTSISADEMERLLKPLEIVKDGSDPKMLIVPPFRNDIERTADIAEEVARLYGYDKIEATLFSGAAVPGGLTDKQKFDTILTKTAATLGYYEVYTYSFVSPAIYGMLRYPADHPGRSSIKIINPLGEDTSIMRTSAVPSVLKTAAYNYSRRVEAVKVFEHGLVYIPDDNGEHKENKSLVAVAYGENYDFYDMKGFAEDLLESVGVIDVDFAAESVSFLQPGRNAVISVMNRGVSVVIGRLGQLHPECAQEFGLPEATFVLELDCEVLYNNLPTAHQYTPLPIYPSVSRDIALVFGDDIPAGDVRRCISESGGKQLVSVDIFDVYKGKGIQEGKKSVAYSLVLQNREKTLSDEEADAVVAKVLKKVKEKYDADLRQ